jgi:hypothetical protein
MGVIARRTSESPDHSVESGLGTRGSGLGEFPLRVDL